MYFPLFVGVLCLSLFSIYYFESLLVLQSSSRGRESWLLSFNVLRMSCYCECSVTLPRGAVGWYSVCESGIC